MSQYTRNSRTKYHTKRDNIQAKSDYVGYLEDVANKTQPGCETPGCVLLDSSLISQTNQKRYRFKIIECGNYFEVYDYMQDRIINDKNLQKCKDDPCPLNSNLEVKKEKWGIHTTLSESNSISFFDTSNIGIEFMLKQLKKGLNENKIEQLSKPQIIESKNIMRSKYQLQRLVKTNIDQFKTFITLTFADNVASIESANKKFNVWRTKIKSIKKDFLYVCVPEFQKRGAVHYHLLTNLDLEENSDLIMLQQGKKTQYDVKYWSYGFSSVFDLKDINVVGYISKYMTKDIDNRLWGKRRYLYSQALKQPKISYIDILDLQSFSKYVNLTVDADIVFQKYYCDEYGQAIEYIEYVKKKDLL